MPAPLVWSPDPLGPDLRSGALHPCSNTVQRNFTTDATTWHGACMLASIYIYIHTHRHISNQSIPFSAIFQSHQKQKPPPIAPQPRCSLLCTNVNACRCLLSSSSAALSQISYTVQTVTGDLPGAGTSARVFVTLHGSKGDSKRVQLQNNGEKNFQRGATDTFTVRPK